MDLLNSRNIWDLLTPQTLLDKIRRNFSTFSKQNSPAIQLAYRLNEIRLNKAENESNKVLDTLKPIWEKIKQEGGVKHLKDLVEQKDANGEGTNKLIQVYDPSTIDKIKKHREAGEVDKIRPYIHKDKFDEWAKSYKEKQYKQINSINYLDYYGKTGEERKADALNHVDAITDWNNKTSMLNTNIYSFIKDEYQSKEYKELQKPENKTALDFYNFTLDINKRAASSGYIHHSQMKTFIPWIEKSLADKLEYGGKYNILEKLAKAFLVAKESENNVEVDPKTQKPILKIPKHFTRELPTKETADDLIKSVGLYANAVLDYESKTEMENVLEGLRTVERLKGMRTTDPKTGKITGIDHSINKNLEYFEHHLDTHFYGKGRDEDIKATGGNVKIGDEEYQVSLVKAGEALKSYYSYNVLGLNTVTSIFRSLTTKATGIYNAGKYYSTGEFEKAYKQFVELRMMKDNANLTINMLKDFLPVEENMREAFDQLAGSKLAEADFQAFLMKMVKSAHNIVQYANYLAHMENAIVINGKLVNARDYYDHTKEGMKIYDTSIPYEERQQIRKEKEQKVKELIDQHGFIKQVKVDEKTGKNIYPIDMEDFSVSDFKSLLRVQGRMLSGNISENDKSMIKSHALVGQMFLFTNWLPQAVEQRFGGLSYSEGIKSYEYGRMRMLAKAFLLGEGGVIKKLDNLISMYKATDKGISSLNKMYEIKKSEYFNKTGLELHMTKEEFFNIYRENAAKFAKETAIMLTFIGMAVALHAALPDKKDPDWEDAQGYFSYMKRIINRGKDELELFYNPTKFQTFGSGAKLPVLGLFDELRAAMTNLAQVGYGLTLDEDERAKHKIHLLPKILHTLPAGASINNIGETLFPVWFKTEEGESLPEDPQPK